MVTAVMENVREYGKPPYKFLVLHGGPGAPGCAAGLCRGLSKKVGVLEHLQKSHTIEGLFDEIKCIIEEYSLNEVVLVGHSFGAWLALLFTERYPQLVSKVVIIGCGPLLTKYLPELIQARKTRKGDNYCALPGSSNDMLYFDEEQHKALMKEIGEMRENGELLARVLNITCPVIAFHGTYDPHPMRGVNEPLEGKIADFRMITMEQCGHDPWKETYAREEFFEKFFEIV